jgi:hypothetical protein
MASDPITTDELIEARMDETGLTREQLLLVVAKSALVRHIATGPDSDRFAVTGTIDQDNTMRGEGTRAGPLALQKRILALIAGDEQLAG